MDGASAAAEQMDLIHPRRKGVGVWNRDKGVGGWDRGKGAGVWDRDKGVGA